ncbi:uncharacterized protein LOC123565378 [Mercenaria mercenaria]|uniref:uncharacterized protein LOC123565378 n=1 Tax=Mercenaria mercenaria TaxID=6596 RepID=UPI00234EB329|nr:uncharacterized protein LOC123565378 [Mercenaria mercenaria]
MSSLAEVKQWFEKGDSNIAEHVTNFSASLFNGITFSSCKSDSSVITKTPTTHPYIDMVHAQLGVAIGGNGYAAKSSDEIGRLAVSMMTDNWDSKLPRHVFKLKYLPFTTEAAFTSIKGKL